MKAEHTELPPRFDPFQLARDGDPYPAYANLRDAGSLLRAGPGVWTVPRYREVAALLRDPRLGPFRFQETQRQLRPAAPTPSRNESPAHSFLDGVMVVADGDDHARLRKLFAPSLHRRLTPQLREQVGTLAEGLLSRQAQAGRLEAVSELAYPLPLAVLSSLFGIPPSESNGVGREVLKLSKLFSPVVAPAERLVADEAVVSLRRSVGSLFERRQRAPSGDILSEVAAATANGLLSRAEAVDNCIFLFFAALETSLNLIAAGCAALAHHPGQMAKLRDDPRCASAAVEEFLRYDAPTQITARMVRSPLEVAGRTLNKGRVLLFLLGSANHDERQFERPEELDVTRSPNPHLSFGAGAHFCLGAGLARMESEVIFGHLARRFPVFEPAGEVVREPCATPRIYLSVPLRVKAG